MRIILGISLLFVLNSANSQVTFGKFILFVPVEDTIIADSCLGTLIGRAKGNLNLKTGDIEAAKLETYSINNDTIADIYVIRRKNGRIISLGLDSTSSQYLHLINTLNGLIEPDIKSNYSEGKGSRL